MGVVLCPDKSGKLSAAGALMAGALGGSQEREGGREVQAQSSCGLGLEAQLSH